MWFLNFIYEKWKKHRDLSHVLHSVWCLDLSSPLKQCSVVEDFQDNWKLELKKFISLGGSELEQKSMQLFK